MPVGDVNKMAEAMRIIIENKELRENYFKKALERAKDFDIDKIIKETQRLLENKFEYEKMAKAVNPFGDGKASQRIIKFLKNKL